MGKVQPVWWWTAGGIVLLALVLLVIVCLRVLGRLEPLGLAQRRLQARMVEAQALAAAAEGLQAHVTDLQKAAEQAQAGVAALRPPREDDDNS
jgi:type II secretory pathway component PulM